MKIDHEVRMRRIGETVDRLVSLDLWCKFAGDDVVRTMYDAALKAVGGGCTSLTMHAARKLKAATKPGNKVLICTGNVLPPWMIIESDGPPGAAVIARMINLALDAIPVLLVEPRWIDGMKRLVCAIGLTPIDAHEGGSRRGAIVVQGFPAEDAQAEQLSREWLASGDITGVIAIEAIGRSENGYYQTGTGGFDNTAYSARFDYLFEEANRLGILTVGIGDHGGELGLGTIKDIIRQVVPTARVPTDPVRGGITPVVPAQIPLVCGVSNWGGYGLAACLAAICGKPDLMHDGRAETRLLHATADAGMIEGMTGLAEPAVDGLPVELHAAFIEILRTAVRRGMEAPYPRAVGFIPPTDI